MIVKKVNLYARMPIAIKRAILRGNYTNIELNEDEIRQLLYRKAVIDEILSDGSTVRLDFTNYNKVNKSAKEIAEEKAKLEAERKAKEEAARKAKEEAAKKAAAEKKAAEEKAKAEEEAARIREEETMKAAAEAEARKVKAAEAKRAMEANKSKNK